MATREENIKKINEQLEQMSNEQLEQIAGGSNIVTHWRPRFAIGKDKLNQIPDSATVDFERNKL